MQHALTQTSNPSETGRQLPMIYILGNSHCGSTLLGFLLSSHPDIINLGELKTKTWLKDRFCSCGQPISTCPLYHDYFSTFNSIKQQILEQERNISPLQFLIQKKVNPGPENILLLHQLYTSLSEKITSLYPGAKYITDSSKSIWLLNDWLHIMPEDKIKILWLKRNTKANVSSFVKRGFSFLPSMAKVLLNNYIIGRFLKKNNLKHLVVHYDRFYASYPEEAKAISIFTGLDIPAAFTAHENHHAISGNKGTRKSFATEYTGLHKDDEWNRILSPVQQKILSWLS
jgi:hypothetical protein